MSDVIISEGGVSRKFAPVDKLKVNNQGSGVSLWVSDKEVGSANITNNGVYAAVEDEYYAYDEVIVDVPEDLDDPSQTGSVTGHDPTDGNDYEYSLNEDGELDVSMIPAAIHIVVPPRKLKYEDGETINFTGIHVYLMDGNNKRYTDSSYPTGEIPFGELMFPVTVAGGDGIGQGGRISDLIDFSIPSSTSAFVMDEDNDRSYDLDGYETMTIVVTKDFPLQGYRILRASSTGSTNQFTHNNKTVYWTSTYANFHADDANPYVKVSQTVDSTLLQYMAWTIIYGEDGDISTIIPVQWMRSDGEILEDTFEIEIVSEQEPVPEPQPDPWAGYADVSWNGHHYNLNRRIVPEVHYANGYCWQEGTTEYTVEQAVGFGWLIRIGM